MMVRVRPSLVDVDEMLQLAEVIKNGSLKVGDVGKVVCQNLSNHCSKSRLVP